MLSPLTTASSVSIVIPAYNSCEFLPAAIESAIAQTYRAGEIEIIVVDDGSTDNTKAVCDRYPTVKYVYQANQGLPGARNKGIEVSRGALIIFLDSDDCLRPDAIAIGVNCLEAHPEAGFVFGRYIFRAIDPDGSYRVQKLFDEPPPVASYATILAAQHNIQCATAICRRTAIAAIGGGFLPQQEDMNLFLRLARHYPIHFHDRVVSEYRYHGGNESSKSAKMLRQTLTTHSLEWDYIQELAGSQPELTAAYDRGRATWIKFYGDRISYEAIRATQGGSLSAAQAEDALAKLRLLLSYDPQVQWIDGEAYAAATEALYLQLAPPATLVEWQKQLVPQPEQLAWLLPDRPIQAYPQTQCLHQLFEAQVARTPESIAVSFDERQLTYRELNDRANQLAHQLIALGVAPEVLVGLSVERSLEMVVGILGILKAGGAYVPLDPAYPTERLAYMLADARVPVLVTMQQLAGSFGDYAGTVVCVDAPMAEASHENPLVPVDPSNLIYIIYTSGSTGKPKGVMVTHANVGRLFAATQEWYQFDDRDVWTMFHSYAFDFSVWELWGALIYGGRLVIVPFAVSRSPQDFYELLARERVTVLNQTPSAFRQLMRVATEAQANLKLSLRRAIFGGEALDLQSLKPWFAKYGDTTPQLVNMYGITETTVHVTYRPIAASDLERGSVIGCPIPDLELYILDTDRQPVAIGIAGEMYVGGAGVTRGYLNRPELTAERFIANPIDPHSPTRLYRTGDLAKYLPNGDIEYLGRIDNQVKIRGFRIELGEIEAAIAQQEQVREAVVIVREDEPGDVRLVAYFVPTTAAQIDLAALRTSLKQQLPDYMVPSAFVSLDVMPLTPNGKTDRQALPAPAPVNLGSSQNFVAARTNTETILTEIWQELLRLDRVGVADNFFDLGGNSLLGLKAIARIQARFNCKVSVVRLYQHPTIRSMADYLVSAIASTPTEPAIARPPVTPPVTNNSVAVIGMVGRFPGANNIEELWANLRAGTESITWFDESEIAPSVDLALLADPNYVRAKGVLAGAELFDASFFGISAREAEMMDPQTRILLELAAEALETVGYPAVEDNKIGVYAGSADNTYFEKHLSCQAAVLDRFGEFQTHLVNDRDYLTTRVSYKLNLQGPSINVSTACSTSLVAIIQAYQGLLNGQCDLALAGGVAISTPQNQGYLHQEGSIFTPDGHCRPFDANARGTLFNNGAGIVVLKRLADAIADGDRIYTVIKGVGMNNDGADKVSFTAPSVKGQMKAILQAQQSAGIQPESISYIEAHGTATALGDPIEVEALTQAFRTQTAAQQFCGIGSIKSNLGHLTAAAGVAGTIKTALALYHRQIPPSINFSSPNPHIDFAESPFYVNDKLVDWPSGDTPRRAGVSSFGGGGTNAHIILEEPPQVEASGAGRPHQLLLLSAKTATALEQQTINLKEYLQQHPELNLADVAFTLQIGRNGYNYRRSIVCQNTAEAIDHLATLPHLATATRQVIDLQPGVVFVFPGQGAQYVQMGRE
uniref:amino acid adenylation domain-containing protein n=1 Tax=Chamaesiphon sp. VAR_69_metabat_338 TaxID=2964704 RepID=UPI00286DA93A